MLEAFVAVLAAVLCRLLDRTAAEGRRQASHSFIAATGAFAFLRDHVAMKASMWRSVTVDVSVECVGMLERLMLAQAQECVFENTIAKGSSAAVSAKISRQRQLESLGAQRAGLEDMLKEMKRKDDILPKLMTSTGSYEDLFRKEISKYDHICKEIAENVKAQEHLLLEIQTQNNDFVAVFNIEDYRASQWKFYKQIEAAITKYQEIEENINEGLKFYVTLQRQMAGLSFQDGKNTGAYNYPSVGHPHQPQRPPSQQQADTGNIPQQPHPPPCYAPPQHPPVSGYAQTPPPYGSQQQPPPPYNLPAAGPPYAPSQNQQQPGATNEYGQPAYAGWRGTYYNSPGQQPGSMPRPPYTVQPPYHPPQQGGYYRQ